jgi:hypothetical protein
MAEFGRLAALALCLPGWIALREVLPGFFRDSVKAVGTIPQWFHNGLMLGGAIVLSFVANTLWILLAFPEVRDGVPGSLFLLGRVSALSGGLAIAALAGLVLIAVLCGAQRRGATMALLSLGALLVMATILILLNGLRTVDPFYLRPLNIVYGIGLSVPPVALFCRHLASGNESLAATLMNLGKRSHAIFHERKWVVPLVCLSLFVALQHLLGHAHSYYGFGFGTALFYSALNVAVTWYLLTWLSRRVQATLGWAALGLAMMGIATFVPAWDQKAVWTSYIKFDKNVGSMMRAYHSRNPRPEAEFTELRRMLSSAAALVTTEPNALRRQELTFVPQARRPHVFFIVVDSLRQKTYSASPEHIRKYPGVAWMSERFVAYENTWTSYNSTIGSCPSYLNGVYSPAWYLLTEDHAVKHDNILYRAADLARYRCYNLATFSDDFGKFWPADTWVKIAKGGQGLGDPGVILPQTLALLDAHTESHPGEPAFFYLHFYNLHQPLKRRPEVPFNDRGLHWMRALYEHNTEYLDLHLRAFLEKLEQRGILEHALVVLTSDHGEEVFDLGGLYHGWQINPWVMHVPLFIHFPQGQAGAPPRGTVSQRPVNLVDIAPTICQIMGTPITRESPWQGISLLEPEPPEPRTFPMLSWKTRLLGRVTFSPARLSVLDLNSGGVETFVQGETDWVLSNEEPPHPVEFARSLASELRDLYRYWRIDPEQGRRVGAIRPSRPTANHSR